MGLRKIQIEEMIKELRGPRNGVYEELINNSPYDEYVTGILVTTNKNKKDPENIENESIPDDIDALSDLSSKNSDSKYWNNEDSYEDEVIFSSPNEINPAEVIKSFGLSFFVIEENKQKSPELELCITWARYTQNVTPDNEIAWKRNPYLKYHSIKITGKASDKIAIYSADDGSINLSYKVFLEKSSDDRKIYHIFISLINNLNWNKLRECSAIFQPSIRINAKYGKITPKESESKTELEYIYRNDVAYARGYMCSAVWKGIDYNDYLSPEIVWADSELEPDAAKRNEFLNCDVRTEFLPLSDVLMPDFRWHDSNNSPMLDAEKLSEAWDVNVLSEYLNPISESYKLWIEENEKKAESGVAIVNQILDKQKRCLERIDKSIKCLIENEDARLAFCYANRVLLTQNEWKQNRNKHSNKATLSWRPFQLGFILECIESIYSEDSTDRDVLDLLWVPTGGGKTEAYLALMAFTIGLRRIKTINGCYPDYDENGGGVSILTRYTLRLLAIQQFRRTLSMVTAAEYLRIYKMENGLHGWRPVNCSINTDWIYGGARISIGLLVGSGLSPNRLRDDDRNKNADLMMGAINALKGLHHSSDPAHVLKCPVCGEILTIPYSSDEETGLDPGIYTMHLIVKNVKHEDYLSPEDLTQQLQKNTDGKTDNISIKLSCEKKLSDRIYILKVDIVTQICITADKYNKIIKERIRKINDLEILSFSPSNPGYFPTAKTVPDKKPAKENIPDFTIYCPNPHCQLNTNIEWEEKLPLTPEISNPLLSLKAMPIPAYTVDEQVFHRCPTVILGTVDKIAQFAFNPEVSTIFGNVNSYNKYYGYMRDKAEEYTVVNNDVKPEKQYRPKYCSEIALSGKNTVNVKPFVPPDLIVQDELHLLEGPLGSMFGIYELMIRALFFHLNKKVKYIASSATVNNADTQVSKLFNLGTSLFPPSGITAEDSFFVRLDTSSRWTDDKPGRVYMGVLGSGKGTLTPSIRIWSRLLKTSEVNKDNVHAKNFWTIVGYCNSIRELGGLNALFHDDIVERLDQISKDCPVRDINGKSCELSSRLSSSEIPFILDKLEDEGKSGDNNLTDHYASVFTTSMFGTGVDIPHLSLMVVDGQPKTTAQYIQATGRVGREIGSFIVVLYKPGRPRDLSHYEMFGGYHKLLNLSVEQISVSPFSTGCLDRAAAGILVSYLRNVSGTKVNWGVNDGSVVLSKGADDDFRECLESILAACSLTDKGKVKDILISLHDSWISRVKDIDEIKFNEARFNFSKVRYNVVLGDLDHPDVSTILNQEDKWSVFRNVPTSLRDIEKTTPFGVKL